MKWVSKFGGPGKGEGKFATPHGIWIDRREGKKQRVAICDRAHHTLQFLEMDGKYAETPRVRMPANLDTWKNLLLVPELHARITLLNEKNEVVAKLGDDAESVVKKKTVNRARPTHGKRQVRSSARCPLRGQRDTAAEWVATGRVTKLKRLS